MTRFGIEIALYYCPRINRGVILSLHYDISTKEKIYQYLKCESKSDCVTHPSMSAVAEDNWDLCPAYKVYIKRRHEMKL